MAIATQVLSHHQVRNHSIGKASTDATAAADTSFTVGYIPRRVVFINLTDRITLTWYEGMAPDSALRTDAAGGTTLITSAGITANASLNGFSVKAAAIPASKDYVFDTVG